MVTFWLVVSADVFVFFMLLLESIRSYLSEICDIKMNVDYSFLYGNLNLSISVSFVLMFGIDYIVRFQLRGLSVYLIFLICPNYWLFW